MACLPQTAQQSSGCSTANLLASCQQVVPAATATAAANSSVSTQMPSLGTSSALLSWMVDQHGLQQLLDLHTGLPTHQTMHTSQQASTPFTQLASRCCKASSKHPSRARLSSDCHLQIVYTMPGCTAAAMRHGDAITLKVVLPATRTGVTTPILNYGKCAIGESSKNAKLLAHVKRTHLQHRP